MPSVSRRQEAWSEVGHSTVRLESSTGEGSTVTARRRHQRGEGSGRGCHPRRSLVASERTSRGNTQPAKTGRNKGIKGL